MTQKALDAVEAALAKQRGLSIPKTTLQYIWNTGRLYQKDGQIIAAELRGDKVYFTDRSRHITGAFKVYNTHLIDSAYKLKELVMFHYDQMQYENSCHTLD